MFILWLLVIPSSPSSPAQRSSENCSTNCVADIFPWQNSMQENQHVSAFFQIVSGSSFQRGIKWWGILNLSLFFILQTTVDSPVFFIHFLQMFYNPQLFWTILNGQYLIFDWNVQNKKWNSRLFASYQLPPLRRQRRSTENVGVICTPDDFLLSYFKTTA